MTDTNRAEITITGFSDDLIEITGHITQEYMVHESTLAVCLVFSSGTIIRCVYDIDGIWRLTMVKAGRINNWIKTDGVVEDDTFDKITLRADAHELSWVAITTEEIGLPKPQ